MSTPNLSKLMPLVAIGAVIALAVVSRVIPLRGGDDLPASGTERSPSTDPMALDLIRCRAVKFEQASDYDRCHKIWTEHRRRFLVGNKPSDAPAATNTAILQPADPVPKDQSRLPRAGTGTPQAGRLP